MNYLIRPISAVEALAFQRADSAAFGSQPSDADLDCPHEPHLSLPVPILDKTG
jgi:hypothetical protein